MRFRREPTHSTLQRHLRYAYVRARKAGLTQAELTETVRGAELDFQWVAQLDRLPGGTR